MQEKQPINYQKLNRVGGWMYLMVFRLLAAAVMAAVSIAMAPSLDYTRFIPLFCAIAAAAVVTIVLLFLKRRAFRISYCVFAVLALLDYVFARDASGFVACVVVEACWVLYLFSSLRVKLVLGLATPPGDVE